MASAVIKLSQKKIFVGPQRFGVLHKIESATPSLLRNPFLIDVSSGLFDKERLVRVASLSDLVSGGFEARQLTVFKDASIDAGVALPGDKLVLTSWPPEWGSAAPEFTVAAAGVRQLVVSEPFRWSVSEPPANRLGLGWELWRGSTKVLVGTKGFTARFGGDGLCLTDQFFAFFQDGTSALNHMVTVQTYVRSLAASAGLDGQQFEQYAPGNPVINTFTE